MAAMFGWFSAARVFASRSKPRQPLGVGSNRVGQNLDGDLPLQVGVGRAIHLAHPAHADLGGDFVRAEAGARSQSHKVRLEL